MLRHTTKIIIYSSIIIGLALMPIHAHAQIDTNINHVTNISPKSNVIPRIHALCKLLYPPAPNHNASDTMINMCTSSHIINAYRQDQQALMALIGGDIIYPPSKDIKKTPKYAAEIEEIRSMATKNCIKHYPQEKTICGILGANAYVTVDPSYPPTK